jgi:hypothetical protein
LFEVESSRSFEPHITRVLATNSINEVDAGVIRYSSIFEFPLNRDDVGRVTERGEGLAE